MTAWRKPVFVGTAVAGATAVISVLDPVSHHVPLCALLAFTGFDCPACGGLRSVFSLSHGDVAAAASHNLLFTVAVPFLVVGWALWMFRAFTRPDRAMLPRPRWMGVAALAVMAVFMVARNLPALAWLAST